MKKKYWITRDSRYKKYTLFSPDYYNIYIWKSLKEPVPVRTKENKGIIGSMNRFLFKDLYEFTPKKGSCELVELDFTIKRNKNKK